MKKLETLNERAAWAYWCLADEYSERPSMNSVEEANGITHQVMQKVLNGHTRGPTPATVIKIAKALGVTTDWLINGTGPIPVLRGSLGRWPKWHDEIRENLAKYESVAPPSMKLEPGKGTQQGSGVRLRAGRFEDADAKKKHQRSN